MAVDPRTPSTDATVLAQRRTMMKAAPEPKICVIGAGPSGLTVAKKLIAAGLSPHIYEQGSDVGGQWCSAASPHHSSVAEFTHTISSKTLTQWEDYPVPADYPDYPSQERMLAYIRSYARRFGLYERIAFGTRVVHCDRFDSHGWHVTLEDPEGRREMVFEHLVVCNGHHWDPLMPEYPGTFAGRLLHSHDVKSVRGFERQRVLIIGGGNSACDCGCVVSRVAAKTAISMRRGYWIIPKLILGIPTDVFYSKTSLLPPRIRRFLVGLMVRFLVGSYERYGLQRPDHRILDSHPTLNSELLERLRHGDIDPRVDIERFDGKTVYFKDGGAEDYDVIIACTGFRISFPFLDHNLLGFSDGAIPLFLRVFHPVIPNLYFVGLVQPQGSVWQAIELQATLIAEKIAGRLRLPDDMGARAQDENRRRPFRFVASQRHAIEVDVYRYRRQLELALKRLAI